MSLADFRRLLAADTLDVPHAGLLLARNLAYPDLVIERYTARLDALAAGAAAVGVTAGDSAEQAEALLYYLATQAGLHGDEAAFGDPRGSFLNDVLERGVGLPIALSVIYVAVAQRLAMPAYGIALPGHFISGVGTANNAVYIDLYGGTRLSGSDCVRLVRTATGFSGPFRTEWLAPAQPHDIVLRMLNNLRGIYVRNRAWSTAARTLDHIAVIRPDLPDLDRDRGLIAFAQGELPAAANHLERYLALNPQAPDRALLQRTVGPALAAWAGQN